MDVSQDPPTQYCDTQEQPISPGNEYEEIDFEAAFEAIRSTENYQDKRPVDRSPQSKSVKKAKTDALQESTIWDPISQEEKEDEPELESVEDLVNALRNSGVIVTHEEKGFDNFKDCRFVEAFRKQMNTNFEKLADTGKG